MKVHTAYNVAQFSTFAFDMTDALNEWWLIEMKRPAKSPANAGYMAYVLMSLFSTKEGIVIIGGEDDVICLARLGAEQDGGETVDRIASHFPLNACKVQCTKINNELLENIKDRIAHIDKEHKTKSLGYMASQRSKRSKNTVLVADDDPLIRNLLETALKPLAEVHVSKEGDDALQLYLKHMPDVVFLDIHMPGESGVDVLESIKTYDPDAFVVMLSADSAKNNVIGTHRLGSSGFIRKPFTRDKIEAALKKCPTFDSGYQKMALV